jgi:hypothetical protein
MSELGERQLQVIASLIDPCPPEVFIAAVKNTGFDEAEYLATYGDLQRAGLQADGALFHFLTTGHKEARRLPGGAPMQGIDRLLDLQVRNTSYLRLIAQRLIGEQLAKKEHKDTLWHNTDQRLIDTLRRTGAVPYFVIGDSHSALYMRHIFHENHWLVPLHMLCSGGSAMGLGNERSRSNYRHRLLTWAGQASAIGPNFDIPIFLKFGQVDAEFVWIYRRIREGQTHHSTESFEAFAIESISKFAGVIDNLQEHLPKNVIRVCSIFPPILSDGAWRNGYVNAHIGFLEGDRGPAELRAAVRNLEIPDLTTRTHLHTLYNAELQRMCARRGIIFVNDFAPMISPGGAISADYAKGHSGEEHHLSFHAITPVISQLIRTFITVHPPSTSPFDRVGVAG